MGLPAGRGLLLAGLVAQVSGSHGRPLPARAGHADATFLLQLHVSNDTAYLDVDVTNFTANASRILSASYPIAGFVFSTTLRWNHWLYVGQKSRQDCANDCANRAGCEGFTFDECGAPTWGYCLLYGTSTAWTSGGGRVTDWSTSNGYCACSSYRVATATATTATTATATTATATATTATATATTATATATTATATATTATATATTAGTVTNPPPPPQPAQPTLVQVSFSIEGISYELLASNNTLKVALKDALRTDFAADMNMSAEEVTVILSAGSVVATFQIETTDENSAEIVARSQAMVSDPSAVASIQAGIVSTVMSVPGMTAAITGDVSVGSPTQVVSEDQEYLVGDPHVVNVAAEHFEIRAGGQHKLVEVPRAFQGEQRLQLRIDAAVEHLDSANCNATFMTNMSVWGKWLEGFGLLHIIPGPDAPSTGLLVNTQAPRDFFGSRGGRGVKFGDAFVEIHMALGGVTLLVSKRYQGRYGKQRGFLDLRVIGLKRWRGDVGGLLGHDNHTRAEEPDERCLRHRPPPPPVSSSLVGLGSAEEHRRRSPRGAGSSIKAD